MAQLVGASSSDQKVIGSIPSQGTHLGCGFGTQSRHTQYPLRAHTILVGGHMGGNQLMLLSHINVSLPPSLSLKALKKCSQVRIKKIKQNKDCPFKAHTQLTNSYHPVAEKHHLSACQSLAHALQTKTLLQFYKVLSIIWKTVLHPPPDFQHSAPTPDFIPLMVLFREEPLRDKEPKGTDGHTHKFTQSASTSTQICHLLLPHTFHVPSKESTLNLYPFYLLLIWYHKSNISCKL